MKGCGKIKKIISLSVLRSFAAYSFAPAVGLITAPILAQSLGVEGRGQLAAILQPLTVADSLAALGIPTATAYFIARGSNPRKMQKLAYIAGSLTALVAFAILMLYSQGVSEQQGIPQFMLVLIWASVIPGAMLAIRRSTWTGLQNWKRIDTERTVFSTSRLTIIVVLAAVGISHVLWFATSPIIAGLVVSSIILGQRIRTSKRSSSGQGGPRPLEFYRFSIYAAMGTVSASASARLDQAIMPGLTTSEQLGLYAVAVTVAEVPLLIGTVLARNLMSEASAGSRLTHMAKQIILGFIIAVLASISIGALSTWLIPVIFGEEFRGSITPIYLLLAATCFSVVTLGFSAIITGWGRPLMASLPQIISVALTITAFILWGNGISAVNAAWISLAGQLSTFIAVSLLLVISSRAQDAGREPNPQASHAVAEATDSHTAIRQ